ncbi:hypothetical protein PVK06_013205 [Gossypium arboreum]|uniref:Reverse transcriptase domain-containing protein n=1 Tax=Gossypium arboreum TaxID=29729 RepID=A0ABR0QDU8_GOSAR|nr:hypothetical protein PVK06_013205 [Gossypium arboreum]
MEGLKGKTAIKLRKLKGAIKKWKMEDGIFLERSIVECENRIKAIDDISENRKLTELEIEELKQLNIEVSESIKLKESIWRQNSRMTWLKEWDVNNAFFHRAVKIKAKRKMVLSLKIGNRNIKDPKEMKEGLVNYFKNYFGCSVRRWKMGVDLKFKLISEESARKLEAPFLMEEINEAVWSCDESKAPGLDGFNLCFYRKCLEIVKHDLLGLMPDFFTFGKLEKSINSSFITLIPKVENLTGISEFRPICLVSSLYKIVSKVLSRRLREVVGEVVSETQCAFIKGRQIFGGILIANELIHSVMKRNSCGGKLVFKLDFSKAYDCVRWDFLELVLSKMGFGEKWRSWMLECLSTARGAVIINGSSSNEFRFCRGLKQRDPLSPFLFILVTEVLHLALDKASEEGLIKGFNDVI